MRNPLARPAIEAHAPSAGPRPAESRHRHKVERLAAQFRNAQGSVVLGKKTSHLFRTRDTARTRLKASDFDEVLSIDPETLTARVEGMITFEKLVRATLRHGVSPQVAIELKGITAGGAVSGVGIEASSFKFGLFHQTVEEMEVLVPTGEVVTCSPEQDRDLFYALPNSYGTLGYILSLTLRLVPARPFVRIRHLKFTNPSSMFAALHELSRPGREHDFLEGVAFSRDSFVISVGEFAASAPYRSDYTFLKAYYKSLRARDEDYLSTEDFIFRWDADWFWGSRGNMMQIALFRFLLGKWLLHSGFYMKLLRLEQRYQVRSRLPFLGGARENVIQDVLVPVRSCEEFLRFVLDDLKILPAWLCPLPGSTDYPLLPLRDEDYVDFGIWASLPPKSPGYWNKIVEAKTAEVGGVKSLYSDVFYNREDFWENSDFEAYERVKSKYDPAGRLPGLYEKVTGVISRTP